jgi:hypothetical protein
MPLQEHRKNTRHCPWLTPVYSGSLTFAYPKSLYAESRRQRAAATRTLPLLWRRHEVISRFAVPLVILLYGFVMVQSFG